MKLKAFYFFLYTLLSPLFFPISLFANSHPPSHFIQEFSDTRFSMFQGDELILNIKSQGEEINYRWTYLEVEVCKTAECILQTSTWSVGYHHIKVVAKDPNIEFTLFYEIEIKKRPIDLEIKSYIPPMTADLKKGIDIHADTPQIKTLEGKSYFIQKEKTSLISKTSEYLNWDGAITTEKGTLVRWSTMGDEEFFLFEDAKVMLANDAKKFPKLILESGSLRVRSKTHFAPNFYIETCGGFKLYMIKNSDMIVRCQKKNIDVAVLKGYILVFKSDKQGEAETMRVHAHSGFSGYMSASSQKTRIKNLRENSFAIDVIAKIEPNNLAEINFWRLRPIPPDYDNDLYVKSWNGNLKGFYGYNDYAAPLGKDKAKSRFVSSSQKLGYLAIQEPEIEDIFSVFSEQMTFFDNSLFIYNLVKIGFRNEMAFYLINEQKNHTLFEFDLNTFGDSVFFGSTWYTDHIGWELKSTALALKYSPFIAFKDVQNVDRFIGKSEAIDLNLWEKKDLNNLSSRSLTYSLGGAFEFRNVRLDFSFAQENSRYAKDEHKDSNYKTSDANLHSLIRFSPTVEGSSGFRLFQRSFQKDRRDKGYGFELNTQWNLFSKLALEAGLKLENQKSSDSEYSYKRTLVTSGLDLHF